MKGGVRAQPDVSALASLSVNKLCVLVWNYHDDEVVGPVAEVKLAIAGLPEKLKTARVQNFRIDDDHSNAFTVWRKMNSPMSPTPEQFTQLEKAGQLTEFEPPKNLRVKNGGAEIKMDLPRQAVALLVIEWK